MLNHKRGQQDVIAWVAAVVAILILAPIMLNIANEVLGGFSTAINSSSEQAAIEVTAIQTTFTETWDWVIAIAFLVNILMLFVFAFLVDTHPIFSLFYLLSAVFTLAFAHYVVVPISTILSLDAFAIEAVQLPITNFIVLWFDIILLAVIIVTGIIMYGKFRSGGLQR